MKRGKDDDKLTEPMFPRLHVNDTEKGGPRAPPRNKMALYEQLTIPSQKYYAKSSLCSSSSTSQGPCRERAVHFPLYQPPSLPTDLDDNLPVRRSDVTNLNSIRMQAHSRKKPLDEDDFRVPIFSHSEKDQQNYNGGNNIAGIHTPVSLSFPARLLGTCSKETNQSKSISPSSLQGIRNLEGQKSEEFPSTIGHTDISKAGSSSGQLAGSDVLANQECQKNILIRLQENGSCFQKDGGFSVPPTETTSGNGALVETMKDTEKGSLEPKLDSHGEQACKVTDVIEKGTQSRLEKHGSLLEENINRGEDVSDSMVELISGFDITPDDVVGIIGPKHFWMARKAIADQQRVFAVQIFELHRLIKVQRLIAGSPDILLESNAYVGRPPLKYPSVKKLPIDCAPKPPLFTRPQKDDSQGVNCRIEGSAENYVGKVSSRSPENAAQPSNVRPFSENRPSSPVKTDTKDPWCFPQTSGHQWLVPMMSPSEGLIYKPYPAAGFMGPIPGSCGPPVGPIPVMSSFMNSHASPDYEQGAGFPPGVPFIPQTYFPPFGMHVMNSSISGSAAEQINLLNGSDLNGQTGQLAGDGPNVSIQRQSSCNMQRQKKGGISDAVKVVPGPSSTDNKMRGSTASSPSERLPGVGTGTTSKERDARPLFSSAPAPPVLEGSALPPERGQPTRVIRVVPHNRRSASESANRIFQSIQHERQQQESN